MSAIENTVVSDSIVSAPVKKSFPAKYLKYLSYGLYIIKQMYPDDYKQKAIEHLHLYDSIESIMEEIDTLDVTLENEVKEIKRDALKKTKSPRKSRAKGKKASDETITEQIVELANEPTIVRGPIDTEETADVPVETKVAKKPRAAPKKKAIVEEPKDEVTVEEPKDEVTVDEPKEEPKEEVAAKKPRAAPKKKAKVEEPKEEVTVEEPKDEVTVEEPKDEPKEEVAAKKPRAAPKKKAKVEEPKEEVKEDKTNEEPKEEVKEESKVSKKRVTKSKAKKSESVISEESPEPMTPELTEDPEQ
jgi:hypothetical protein